MTTSNDLNAQPVINEGPSSLGHERLHVYQAALEFLVVATEVLDKLPSGTTAARDQLDRASLSIVLNIAEGAGKSSAADKRRYYSSARGSAMECGGILDALRVKRKIDDQHYARGKHLLVRIVQMLTKM